MNELDRIGLLLTDLPVYLANGALVILYWLIAHMPALTSLVCALLMAWRLMLKSSNAPVFGRVAVSAVPLAIRVGRCRAQPR
jgi:hypothetical protein